MVIKAFKLSALVTTSVVWLAASGARADVIVDPDGTGANEVAFGFDANGAIRVPPTNGIIPNPSSTIYVGRSAIIRDQNGNVVFDVDAPGTLEVNAQSTGNSITSLNSLGSLQVGRDAFTPNEPRDALGIVRIDGNGSPGSASINVRRGIQIFSSAGKDSKIEITNGGQLTSDRLADSLTSPTLAGGLFVGWDDINGSASLFDDTSQIPSRPPGNASVLVDGPGSLLAISGGYIGIGTFSDYGADTLTISNGGKVTVTQASNAATFGNSGALLDDSSKFNLYAGDGAVEVGGNGAASNGRDVLSVTGTGSTLTVSTSVTVRNGADAIVANGGKITQSEVGGLLDRIPTSLVYGLSVEGFTTGWVAGEQLAEPRFLVTGTGSEVSLTRDVRVGNSGQPASPGFNLESKGSGQMTVEQGGVLSTTRDITIAGTPRFNNYGLGGGTFTINSSGTVNARNMVVYQGGLLNGNGGTINADVIVNGGTVSPGVSPGSMTINGDLDFIDGWLKLEIGGPGAGQFDTLNILGDLIAPSGLNMEISFLDGFLPTDGQSFSLLTVLGNAPMLNDPSLLSISLLGLGSGAQTSFDFANGRFNLLVGDAGNGGADVPIPGALPLLASALGGLALARRRKKSKAHQGG